MVFFAKWRIPPQASSHVVVVVHENVEEGGNFFSPFFLPCRQKSHICLFLHWTTTAKGGEEREERRRRKRRRREAEIASTFALHPRAMEEEEELGGGSGVLWWRWVAYGRKGERAGDIKNACGRPQLPV